MENGFTESFELGSDFVFVQGWLVVGLAASGYLSVEAGNRLVGRALLADLWERPDLQHPTISRRAFRCLVRVDASLPVNDIRVRYEVAGRDFELPLLHKPKPFVAKGSIECREDWGLSGWVWHPHYETPTLRLDDGPDVTLPCTVTREDLPIAYRSARPNGFEISFGQVNLLARSFDQAAAICDGRQRVARLFIGGDEIGTVAFSKAESYLGKVERIENNILTGWACKKDGPGDAVLIDICIGGTRYVTCEASHHRGDLLRLGRVKQGGGFRVLLPPNLPGPSEARRITARFHRNGEALPGIVPEISERPETRGVVNFWDMLPPRPPNVSIIVPIYNAAASLARCLASLVAHTTGNTRLILIDDASPQAAVREVLAEYEGRTNVLIVENEENLGFTRTVNRGISLAGRDDVVFLNSDTEVTPCWLEHLVTAAYHSGEIGTVTPLSDNAGAFSVPELNVQNLALARLGQDHAARMVAGASGLLFPRVPTGNGFCMYVRRACIDVVGLLDATDFPMGYGEENDFCQRALRAGFHNIVDDRTLIFHERSASFLDRKGGHYTAGRQTVDAKYPEYAKQIRVFRDGRSLQEIRWRIRHASAASPTSKRRVLYVIATETGGTPQTNRDLMTALHDRLEPLLLRCNAREIFLSRFTPDGDLPLERHQLYEELDISTHRSAEYNRVVAELLVRHAVELVHIRHVAWHSLDLTRICTKLSIPVVFSFHDFYTVCPNVKLLDENNVHCAGRCTPTNGACGAELWPKAGVPELKHRFVHRWREMQREALQLCDAFVTTSPNARRILVDAFPELGLDDRLEVIPHGRSFDTMRMLAAPLSPGEPLRVLVPGNISDAKGASLIRAAAALDEGRTVEFHVLGDGGRLVAGPGLHLHGLYARHEIDIKIAAIKPHIGAVLSIWPETYCHTLSEMWSCGVPVLGMEIGAVGERIAETGAGWLVPPRITAADLVATLVVIAGHRDEIARGIAGVAEWQAETGTRYTIGDMGARYLALYTAVLDGRRSFRRREDQLLLEASWRTMNA